MITAERHGNRVRHWRRAGGNLLVLCPAAAAIGAAAWLDQTRLISLLLLLPLPALIFRAPNRLGALLVAWTYYATASRDVPAIFRYFFAGQGGVIGLSAWAGHAVLLALPWAAAHAPPTAPGWRRAIGVMIALLILTVPPFGLFHWSSPLLAAGLLYPGWQWYGVLLTLALLALLASADYAARPIRLGAAAAVALAATVNAVYRAPAPPAEWVAVSLHLGKSPELWSDEMAARRRFLITTANSELARGAKVIIFPESISGSSRRPQREEWQGIAAAAAARTATVLVGEETWNAERSGYRNALVGYGREGGAGTVIVASRVPMPVGDWKFGLEPGATTEIFGDDIVHLHGRNVAFSICYEDFLLWPHRGLLTGRADLLVAATNQWPSSGTSAESGQDMHRRALARIAGVALLTAKNH